MKISNEKETLQDKDLKIDPIQVIQNLFSFQNPFKFSKSKRVQENLLNSQTDIKRGNISPYCFK